MTFEGSKLKIKRAKKHIRDLDHRIAAFVDDFDGPFADTDRQTGHLLLNFPPDVGLPLELSVIIGDAIHNLRTALDLAWVDICEHLGVEVTSKTSFPIRETRKELVDALNGAPKIKGNAMLYERIVDDIKPYARGNDALWPLHRLDIVDKHKLILPVFDSVVITLYIEDELGNIYEALVVKTRGRELTSRYGVGHKYKGKGHAELNIFFDMRSPIMQNEPIRPTLSLFVSRVEEAIRKLESVF
jgi:hypothetical protein